MVADQKENRPACNQVVVITSRPAVDTAYTTSGTNPNQLAHPTS